LQVGSVIVRANNLSEAELMDGMVMGMVPVISASIHGQSRVSVAPGYMVADGESYSNFTDFSLGVEDCNLGFIWWELLELE
jgi:hypothetical protein